MTRKNEPGSQLGNEAAQRAMTREHKINMVLEAWAPPPEQRDKCRRDLEEQFDLAEKAAQREAAQRGAVLRNVAQRKADRDKQINDALDGWRRRRTSANRVAPTLRRCSISWHRRTVPLNTPSPRRR
jgi:hypothetical protein